MTTSRTLTDAQPDRCADLHVPLAGVRWSLWLLVFAGLLSVAAPAWAEQETLPAYVVARARRNIIEGNRLYQAGRFEAALRLYEEAHRFRPRPSTLYNIAQCHRQLKDYDRALFTYRSYLRAAPAAFDRTLVEQIIRELEERVARKDQPAATVAPAPVLPMKVVVTAPTSREPESEVRPWYRRWYVWTVVGAVVAGAVVAGAVAGSRGAPVMTSAPDGLDTRSFFLGGGR